MCVQEWRAVVNMDYSQSHWVIITATSRFPISPVNYIEHSAHGLIRVYNLLPVEIVEATSDVPSFQKVLQHLVQCRANEGYSDWERTLSPRVLLYKHPLRDL